MKIKKYIKNLMRACFGKERYNRAINKKRAKRFSKYQQLPTNRKLVVFEAFMGKKYTDSPRAIYEYMLSDETYSDFRFIWCFRNSLKDQFAFVGENPRTEIVDWGSEKYYETYAKAGYWFTNARIIEPISIKPDQVYTQCWHGTPLKRLFCDIETEAVETKETMKRVIHGDAKRYSYMVSPSKFYTEKITSAFDLRALGKENIVIETGYPRNDSIASCTDGMATEIKKKIGIPEGKKVILYAPTYRENQRNENRKYVYREPLEFDKLKEQLGDEYVILFRAHYYIASRFDFAEYEGFIYDASMYPEINDLYVVSDILVTDYSSVFFDYSILKRPIIYYMYDLEFYRDELRGFYLGLDELPGVIAERQEELVDRIKNVDVWADTDDYRKEIEAFNSRFTYLDDGHASERVVKRVIGI